MMASKISAVPIVRAYLLDLQRNMAKTHDVIMDGRDIGTVVLPDAQVKIFFLQRPPRQEPKEDIRSLLKRVWM